MENKTELHLASLENVSCWPFRKLIHGATDSYTGMMSAQYLIKRRKAWKEIDTYKIDNVRQWIQIATSKESECERFLEILDERLKEEPEKNYVYGIQLNLSCPSPHVIKIGQGPALIKRTKKTISLINTLLKQDKYKVSIKVRLGLNEKDVEDKILLKLFEELKKIDNKNFHSVTVHFKHAKERSRDPYNYEMLEQLSSFGIPMLLNGGINNFEEYKSLISNLPKENCNNILGFVVGRESLRNQDCFIKASNEIYKTNLKPRDLTAIKSEWEELIGKHSPREIYFKRIAELCEFVE